MSFCVEHPFLQVDRIVIQKREVKVFEPRFPSTSAVFDQEQWRDLRFRKEEATSKEREPS